MSWRANGPATNQPRATPWVSPAERPEPCEGRADEANALLERAKKIKIEQREKLAEAERAKVGEDQAGQARRENEQARRESDRMRREIEELHRAGKHDDAVRLEQKLAERKAPPEECKECAPAERVQHVLQAIEHLRAAGLKEPAEGLAQIAKQMRAESERQNAVAPERTEKVLRETQEGMQQLRGQLEKMQRQLEELRAQAGKPHGGGDRN